jgi:D-beta-D-heptose 7-phosphate kinase/D-beta-D-heptose 1-phosphate adenosyltransferase
MKDKKRKQKVVMISGGFDPIHIGHIRHIQEAKKLGDKLIIVLNNDNWLRVKKGKEFMPENERKEILEAIKGVDEVIISGHSKDTKNMSVCEEIKKVKPDIFAKGGDRKPDGNPVPEVNLCEKLGVEIIYDVGHGGKIRSSSDLAKEYAKHLNTYVKKN